MKRRIKNLVKRKFPRIVQFLHEVVCTLNGWRFADLKNHIEASVQNHLAGSSERILLIQLSLAQLERLGRAEKPALAVITPLPPETTGLSNFSIESFKNPSYPIDLYSNFKNSVDYFSLEQIASCSAPIHHFSIDVLFAAQARRGYFAKIYQIGNSNHIAPIMQCIAADARSNSLIPRLVEIHDPCLLNLNRLHWGPTFIPKLKQIYGIKTESELPSIEGGDYRPLVSNGIYGIKSLFLDVPVDAFIVHSNAAKAIIQRDWPELDANKIHVLFHPVFPTARAEGQSRKKHIRLGTFGIPAASKQTGLIVQAFQQLARTNTDIELLVAGFGASSFFSNHESADQLIVVDSPNDKELEELMASCDLAIQLRAENFGESSGVIPQLIALRTPVITSRVGAFAEYGDCVAYAEADISAEQLADQIETELRAIGTRTTAQYEFARQRTPEIFQRQIRSIAFEIAQKRGSP